MNKFCAETVQLSPSEMPRVRKSGNPWTMDIYVTLEMEGIAQKILRNPEETEEFIRSIES